MSRKTHFLRRLKRPRFGVFVQIERDFADQKLVLHRPLNIDLIVHRIRYQTQWVHLRWIREFIWIRALI